MKKIKNTDLLFVVALVSVLLLHLYFVFIAPLYDDEGFYVTLPFRFVNGDSLVQHEWHLTQFSSLFSYLPVYIWTAIKGSADGIFIFMRCVYLFIHTAIAVVIYRFFKKYEIWAIMASIIFYIQVPYKIISISYHSMFAIFLLLLSLCLISIYQKKSNHFYIFAGASFGCCCVCNPLFCFGFALYLITCLLWTKRYVLAKRVIGNKISCNIKKKGKLTKKQEKLQKQQILNAFPNMENYSCFFNKEAILRISCGILIIAVIAIIFYFSTGGTINSLKFNIENLLGSSEYDFVSVFSKLFTTIYYFTIAAFGMTWVLPILFIVLLFDKKRTLNTHRITYLLVSVLWSIMFIFVIIKVPDFHLYAVSLPFYMFSTICYWLTENKNKTLFYCMHIPCLIATVFQYLAANTHWAVIGIVLAISNIAGVFFAMDLWKEMRCVSKDVSATTVDKKHFALCRSMIIIGFCIQLLLYGMFHQQGQISIKDAVKATAGPYIGLYMSEEQYNKYNKELSDMDVIRKRAGVSEPVLLATYHNWLYMYLDRPVATYTTWYRGSIDPKLLTDYYRKNPKKIPKYIYTESSSLGAIDEMFVYTKEELSNGVLLSVEKCKF